VPATEPGISVVPANEASWPDLQAIFGARGQASRCQCQRYKLRPRESFASFPAEEGYPITTKNVILEELHVGTEAMFAGAGFGEVSRPTLRRVVMRVAF
jgi:hypothetical protein